MVGAGGEGVKSELDDGCGGGFGGGVGDGEAGEGEEGDGNGLEEVHC